MGIMASPPTATKSLFKEGDSHQGVWAIQRGLNSLGVSWLPNLVEDGNYGSDTETAVAAYQRAVGIAADGVCGPVTQERMVRSFIVRTDNGAKLPKGLGEGIIDGESGYLIAAVNTSVDGGVDCGYTQRRVYTPYTEAAVGRAFDSLYQIDLLGNQLYRNFTEYYAKSAVSARSDRAEYAWRLAALHHNWPYAAGRLANGYVLSNKVADWVHPSLPDWAKTYSGWAKYYAMGSRTRNWAGAVTDLAFGVPRDG